MTVFCRIGLWLCASDNAGLLFLGAFKASVNCVNLASCAGCGAASVSCSLGLTSLGFSSGARALHLCEYLYACKDMLLPQPSQVTLSFSLLVARFNGGGSGIISSTSSGNSCGSSGIMSSTSSILLFYLRFCFSTFQKLQRQMRGVKGDNKREVGILQGLCNAA